MRKQTQNVKILFTKLFLVVQKVKMLLQSQCNWQPGRSTHQSQLSRYSKSLTRKPNNVYNFVGAKSPGLVVDYQGAKRRKAECLGNYSLALWVGVSWGLYHSYLFKTATKSMSSPTSTQQFCFLQIVSGLNHLLLHRLSLSSSFHLSHFLPPLHPHLHPHLLHLHQLLHHVQILLPPH